MSSVISFIEYIKTNMTAESKYTLIPAYYDIALKTKFARNDESGKMLDLIFANRMYDIGHIFK